MTSKLLDAIVIKACVCINYIARLKLSIYLFKWEVLFQGFFLFSSVASKEFPVRQYFFITKKKNILNVRKVCHIGSTCWLYVTGETPCRTMNEMMNAHKL